MRRILLSLILCICSGFLFKANAQKILVTLEVVDESNYPIPFADVMISGTQYGTITDYNGMAYIQCPIYTLLEVSCVGYKTAEVWVWGPSYYLVVLEEDVERNAVPSEVMESSRLE